MTREAFILHDALDRIETATSKAGLALSYAADYFDNEPIDMASIKYAQDTIRTFINITTDYLAEIRREYTEAMSATAHTSDHADHTSTEASRTQTKPDTSDHSAAPDTAQAQHGWHGHSMTTAPQSPEEAAQRIKFLFLTDACGEPARFYHAAIMDWIENDCFQDAVPMAASLGYSAGIQEGKRQERQRRKNRQTAPET